MEINLKIVNWHFRLWKYILLTFKKKNQAFKLSVKKKNLNAATSKHLANDGNDCVNCL